MHNMSYGNYPDLSRVERILVVKLRHHGDVLLTSPVFSLLKKRFPDAQIDALIYKETLPMLEGHPAIENFVTYDQKIKKRSLFVRLWKEAQLLLGIRKKRYDLVLNLTEGDRGAIVALLSGAKCRAGFDPGKSGFIGKKRIYTHIAKAPRTPRHTVEKQLDLLRRVGIFPEVNEKELFFHVPDSARKKIEAHLKEAGLEEGGFFLIHPVSRWRFKCPPPAFTAELIRRLGGRVVLSSGPDAEERAFIQEIVKDLPDGSFLDLGGKMTLKELGALIELSRCLICVDSVPLHIASALKTPVVALFGPSSEINWGPWQNPRAKVVAQPFSCRPCFMDGCGGSKRSECLYTLSTSQVTQAVEELGIPVLNLVQKN
ncbi:MAG: putative lipopolysaccharide heptosyltransferase III [Chlamydiales bacterium]|nr:putative lipopolysaccharide heptosyltransferase III [Chlamydiales bacterium]